MTSSDGSDRLARSAGRGAIATSPEPPDAPETEASPPAAEDASVLCPFLTTPQGTWRAGFAVREHRCGAVQPPAPLALDKQRRLCLTPAHTACATYLAARAVFSGGASAPLLADHAESAARRRPVARTTPVLLERAHSAIGLPVAAGRSLGQVGLLGLLVVAFLVIALARLSVDRGGGTAAGGTPSASASPLSTPAATPTASPTASVAPSAPPSAAATPVPSASPGGTFQTYRVMPGDTLSSIAAKFGTTSQAIQRLNGITNPNLIHTGQILKIP